MTLFRATDSGCPCPAIGYGAARQEFTRGAGLTPIMALDTDGRRIAALRYDNLVVYDSSGGELAAVDIRPAAAQLAGDDVVALVPNELRVYAANGMLRRFLAVPSPSVGRDCHYYSEPQCQTDAELKLQSAARGLAASVLHGGVHVLRLADGRDTVVGYGSEGRFMDDGLVYADGARIRLVGWPSLVLERVDAYFPDVSVEARGADHRVPGRQRLELRERPEGAIAVDHERPLVASHRQLDLVAARLRQLDHTQPVRGARPLLLAPPDGDRAIRTPDLLLDRVGQLRQVTVAFLEQQRAVLHADEARGRALHVRRFRRNDGVVLTLAGDAVNAGLTDDAGEHRPRRWLDEAALLRQPLVQRLRAAEQTHL